MTEPRLQQDVGTHLNFLLSPNHIFIVACGVGIVIIVSYWVHFGLFKKISSVKLSINDKLSDIFTQNQTTFGTFSVKHETSYGSCGLF